MILAMCKDKPASYPSICGKAAKMAVSQERPAMSTSGFCASAFMKVCVPHCATMWLANITCSSFGTGRLSEAPLSSKDFKWPC